jgi:hypothetical protein
MPNPLIATPCYGGMLCVNYVTSIAMLSPMPDIFFPTGSLITRSRNACVAKFRAGPWSHLFFIDADIGFTPASFRRLLTAGYDVAAAPYPFKSDDIAEQGGFVVDANELGVVGRDGFAPIVNAPTGFMCIARSVIDRMAAAGIGAHEFFETMRNGDEYLADDHAFCRRWQSLGGSIHLDTKAELTHQGLKVFRRDFQQHLANRSTK